jgi:hypothetical protein
MIINPGELKERITVLEFIKNGNAYTWGQISLICAKTEQLSGSNLFSQIGIGAKSYKFIIRKKNNLTLHNAFGWKGKHCFLTDIIEIDRMYYEVAAALIEPRTCSIERTGEPVLNELNRPFYSEDTTVTFPGCLTEKYLGHTQGKPMAFTETKLVLVTPKVIELTVGELVTIGNTAYEVLIPHILDDYKNEYEIMAKEDA